VIRFLAALIASLSLLGENAKGEAVPVVQLPPFSHKQHVTAGLKCSDCHQTPNPGKKNDPANRSRKSMPVPTRPRLRFVAKTESSTLSLRHWGNVFKHVNADSLIAFAPPATLH
jgi:hypothetical protein